MTTPLSTNHQAFVNAMKADTEAAKWGFEALLERDSFADFFDALSNAGLFSSSNNPRPIATPDGKYLTIPYWPALDYLEKCARKSREANDFELARKVLSVVKAVSNAVANTEPDNYHTYHKFAEIVGSVPIETVDASVIDLIPIWLGSKFDTGLVTAALDEGLLSRVLGSTESAQWRKACDVLRHVTALKRGTNQSGDQKLISIADDYWLREIVRHHMNELGRRVGDCAATLLTERAKEVFRENGRDLPTSLLRPAIEDHEQNHEWQRVENTFVEGAREVIANWVDVNPNQAGDFLSGLLADESEIARRLAIYIFAEKWTELGARFLDHLDDGLFKLGTLHELYNLLQRRFASFPEQHKAKTLQIINAIEAKADAERQEKASQLLRLRWLSAIEGKGYRPADDAYSSLADDSALSPIVDHPDFLAYSESRWGFGPSAFTSAELVTFAYDGSLVRRLNDFKEVDSWNGPTIRAVSDTLADAVEIDPSVFSRILPKLRSAKYAYQYGVLNGFKRLWDAEGDQHNKVAWDKTWETLLGHFESLLSETTLWGPSEPTSSEVLTLGADWIIGLIADFLEAGTKKDEKAYDPSLLPRAWPLIQTLLDKTQGVDAPGEDPMSQAINSHRGKAIEALVNHTLREARLADKADEKSHAEVWKRAEPTFDAEVAKAKNANFEFSTLAGAYIANLEYLNRPWLEKNIPALFPLDCEPNLLSGLGGLAYAPATRSIYRLLNQRELIESALGLITKGRHTREKLVERVALAYVWQDEDLDSARMQLFFKNRWTSDLEDIADLYWSFRSQKLDEPVVNRILDFLRYCMAWQKQTGEDSADLLQHLARLVVYLRTIGKEEVEWLDRLAAHVGRDFSAFEFSEQLIRLLPQNPPAIAAAFERMVDTQVPYSDYKDRMKELLRELSRHGERERSVKIADKLRSIRGMAEIYEELRLK